MHKDILYIKENRQEWEYHFLLRIHGIIPGQLDKRKSHLNNLILISKIEALYSHMHLALLKKYSSNHSYINKVYFYSLKLCRKSHIKNKFNVYLQI
jgi:hypothetical protein